MQQSHQITWIASFPRSGNTWLRALITAYINSGSVNINEVMQTGDKNPVYYDGIIKKPISEWSMTDQAIVKPAALMRMLEDADGNMMIKTHDCNVDISGIAQIPHDLTRAAIYIVRDPRDIALSFKNHYKTSSMRAAVDKVLDDKMVTRYPNRGLYALQLSWKTHIRSWMRDLPYPVYTLRYEDLLTKPFEIFSEIVHFLKLDYDADIVRKSIDACQFDKFQQQEIQEGFRESVGQTFFYKGKARNWEQNLDKSLQKLITDSCKNEMKALGFPI